MGLFSKQECVTCGKEAGMLGRTKLADKGDKQYICKSCVKTKLSPYVEVGYMSKSDIDRHISQREADAELYEKYFRDFSYPKAKELLAERPWGDWGLGKYELRRHNESGNYVIWEKYAEKDRTFDVFHEDEIEGACIWGEYNDGKDKVKKMPDTTYMTLTELKEFPDEDINKLYLTIFTKHPYLSMIELPIITAGEKGDKNERIREVALDIVRIFNRDTREQLEQYDTSKKEFKKSAKDARKAIFSSIKEGNMDEAAQSTVGTFLKQAEAKGNKSTVDTVIAELRIKNDPKRRF